ncbi:hypothetical protein [Arthrobacter woluwensis]|uniref:hypothetical protein n=1 Tax=Arthrobacter woluwensis TaxID=156980 RepID=UPI00381DA9A8
MTTIRMTAKRKTLAADVLDNFLYVYPRYAGWVEGVDAFRDKTDDRVTHLHIHVVDSEDIPNLTPRSIIEAMQRIAEGRVAISGPVLAAIRAMYAESDYVPEKSKSPGVDAETDDAIIQVAAFGELIYS